MKFLEYAAFRFVAELFRFLPFFVIYALSDFTRFILYDIFSYRKKVVYENIKNSFPDKTEKEILILCRKFYRHLADITLESIKSMTITTSQIKKRYIVRNTDIANSYYIKGESILCLTSHYGNWEYGILGTNHALKHQAVALYLPLSNKYSEKYGLKRRKRFGMMMVAVQETKSIFKTYPEIPFAIIMAADQSPSNPDKAIWVNFLNRETACLHGPEGYALKTNMPVLYLSVRKPRRGYYELIFENLIENPSKCKQGEVTEKYMSRLEKDIIYKPEYYLWSHRRWKHKKNKKYDEN